MYIVKQKPKKCSRIKKKLWIFKINENQILLEIKF